VSLRAGLSCKSTEPKVSPTFWLQSHHAGGDPSGCPYGDRSTPVENNRAVCATRLFCSSMTIVQIKHIKSIGRFRNCAAQGDVTLKKFTLIFGENARGKTTLCAILRSLQSNEPDIIAGRRTLAAADEPNVVITLDAGQALFRNGAWAAPPTQLRIFDVQYVPENIHSGDAIGSDQRRTDAHPLSAATRAPRHLAVPRGLPVSSRAATILARRMGKAPSDHSPEGMAERSVHN
jgi:hypothetical protein